MAVRLGWKTAAPPLFLLNSTQFKHVVTELMFLHRQKWEGGELEIMD